MLKKRRFLKLVIPALGVGLFIYASFRPVYRLRPDMPAEFVDAPVSWPPEKRAGEEKIARAFWYSAVTVIQWKYGYGFQLPQDPPADFSVSLEDSGEDAADSATRARYWHKLREVWYLPRTWRGKYAWDFRWLTNPAISAIEWFQNYGKEKTKF